MDVTGDEIGNKGRRKAAVTTGAASITPLPGLPGGEPTDAATSLPPLPELVRTVAKSRAPRKAGSAPVPDVDLVVPLADTSPMPSAVAQSSVPAQPVSEQATDASPAAEINPVPAMPATPADPVEGLNIMATAATPFPATETTEKAQAMLGDMNGRFKAAFEKSSKMGEEMVELTKGNVEALVASAKIAAKAGETLGQEAAEFSKKRLETTVAMIKSLAAAKSPTELFQLQSEFAKSAFDSAVAEASKFSEAMMKVAGEVAQPLSNRYAVAAEKIKATTL